MTHRVAYVARSDRGLIRANNQDSVFAGDRIMVVADGMGGHAAGDTASRLVVAAFAPLDERVPGGDVLGELAAAARSGNTAIANVVNDNPELDGMGTTVTALLFDGNRLAIAHVGDSRAYLYRGGVLHQLTHDDTFVQSLVDEGRITEADAFHHPQRNLLLRALNGTELEPSLTLRELRAGDRYLICSDGLSGVISAESIADALAAEEPGSAADTLIELALLGGGPDNVTVVVADVVDTGVIPIPALPSPASGDPDATGPLEQIRMTREMPRVPLPPIPEEPAAKAEYADDDGQIFDDDRDDDFDGDRDDDFDGDPDDDFDDGGGSDDDVGGPGIGGEVGVDDDGTGGDTGDRFAGGSNGRAAAGSRGRRWRRRGAFGLAIVVLVAVAIAGSVLWTRTQFFVGALGDRVVVFQGLNGSVLGMRLSSFQEDSCAGDAGCTPMLLSDLQPAARDQVTAGIQAGSLADARDVVTRLSSSLLPPCPAPGGTVPTGTVPGTSGASPSPSVGTAGTASPSGTAGTASPSPIVGTADNPGTAGTVAPRTDPTSTTPPARRTFAPGADRPTAPITGAVHGAAAVQGAAPDLVSAAVQGAAPIEFAPVAAGASSELDLPAANLPAANLPATTPAAANLPATTPAAANRPATTRAAADLPDTSAAAPTVTITRTVVTTPTGTPLAPLPAVPGVTCRTVTR